MNPYLINDPALVSFSGGRTSAYMLKQIVDAHGGKLPDHIVVAFANTGRERPETLRFVHECGSRWGVDIVWLEWRDGRAFDVVGFNSASRNGEPFSALIRAKKYLPNAVARFCTAELKVLTIKRYLLSLGWAEWRNVVGLRFDEKRRVTKRRLVEASDDWREPYKSIFPLYEARVAKSDVDEFWSEQDFDLGIPSGDGNCDGCFLKSDKRLMWTERKWPGTLGWWAQEEVAAMGRFVTEYSMASLITRVRREPLLPGLTGDDDHDVECGLVCGGAT